MHIEGEGWRLCRVWLFYYFLATKITGWRGYINSSCRKNGDWLVFGMSRNASPKGDNMTWTRLSPHFSNCHADFSIKMPVKLIKMAAKELSVPLIGYMVHLVWKMFWRAFQMIFTGKTAGRRLFTFFTCELFTVWTLVFSRVSATEIVMPLFIS